MDPKSKPTNQIWLIFLLVVFFMKETEKKQQLFQVFEGIINLI